jgi:hypothetical protein
MPVFIFILMVSIAIGGAKLYHRRYSRRRLPSITTRDTGRFPGQGHLHHMDELLEEIVITAVALLALPLALYAGLVSLHHFGNRAIGLFEAIAATVLTLLALCYSLVRMRRLLAAHCRERTRLGATLGVGQALNALMLANHRVYHDFPAEDSTIDHVVVGQKGVFAVQTGTRFKRRPHDHQQEATVEYDGRALHFPDGTDVDMIERSKHQAKWLAGWLSQSVGEELTVRAVIALPGWLVRRTSSEGLPVVNPRQFASLFDHIPSRTLSEPEIERIARQLEQQYRAGLPS